MNKAPTKYDKLLAFAKDIAALDPNQSGLKKAVEDLVDRAKDLTLPRGANNPAIAAAREKATAAHRAKGDATREKIMPEIRKLQAAGYVGYKALADQLNELGIETPKGAKWYAASVRRIAVSGQQDH